MILPTPTFVRYLARAQQWRLEFQYHELALTVLVDSDGNIWSNIAGIH